MYDTIKALAFTVLATLLLMDFPFVGERSVNGEFFSLFAVQPTLWMK